MTRSAAPLLAKRRLEPTWLAHPVYVETYGPEVADICGLADYAPDEEQQLLLDLTFALGSNGKAAAFEIDVIAARQNLKTGFIQQAELGWLFVTEESLIVHSAHEMDTTEESFIAMASLIEDTPQLSKRLAVTRGDRPGIAQGNGRWAIHLASGQRLKYKARTKSGGRGLSGNKVVLDEGFALEPTHLGSLLPTLGAMPDPQFIVASSAGKVGSIVLKEIRDRGRSNPSWRQVYVEWGDPIAGEGCLNAACSHEKTVAGCALDDEDRWARIQPALGGRVQPETVRALRQSMPPEEFAREFMVWWDVEDDGEPLAIDYKKWSKLARPAAKQPTRAALVIDVAPNRSTASIGIAAQGKKGRVLVLTRTAEGTAWIIPAVQKLIDKRDILEVALHPGGQAGALIPDLIAAGVEYVALTTRDMGQACAAFLTGIDDKTLEHVDQPELNAAIGNARTKFSGEAELWDRKNADIDISPLVAASAAAARWIQFGDYDTEDSYL